MTEESSNKILKMSSLDFDEKQTATEFQTTGASSIQKQQPQLSFDPELEPLLKENPRRFVIFPIQYHDIWEMYKKVC